MNPEFLDRIAKIADFALTRDEAREQGCCVRCMDPITREWTDHDLREWAISLLCGSCFDEATEDAE